MAHSPLKTFRQNLKKLEGTEYGKTLNMPENVLELFEKFLAEKPNNVDLTALILLLCYEEKCDWDSIAHHFL